MSVREIDQIYMFQVRLVRENRYFKLYTLYIFGQSLLLKYAGDNYTGVSVITKRQGKVYRATKGTSFEIQYPWSLYPANPAGVSELTTVMMMNEKKELASSSEEDVNKNDSGSLSPRPDVENDGNNPEKPVPNDDPMDPPENQERKKRDTPAKITIPINFDLRKHEKCGQFISNGTLTQKREHFQNSVLNCRLALKPMKTKFISYLSYFW